MKETTDKIKQAVEIAPTQPGCYLWKKNATVLYVGKANNINTRLKSYLRPETFKTRLLMEEVNDLEWITTENGSEALILEANLVKEWQPRFNVRLKDDKQYPYICISTGEMYPRVFITRNRKNDNHKYFGPFTDGRATKNMLEVIHKIFPVRKVRQKLPLAKPRRPCMNYHIGRCLAPCQGNVPEVEYNKIIEEILLFLEGKREKLETIISERMQEYSENLEYEKAAMYRDILSNIRRSTERQSVVSPGGADEDIIALSARDDHGQIALLEVRGGRVLGRKTFPLVGVESTEQSETLASFIRDYYLQNPISVNPPARIIVAVKIPERKDLENSIQNHTGAAVKIRIPTTPESGSLLRMAEKNADLLLSERILATKIEARNIGLEHIAEMLRLEKPPLIIDCFDISHLQGSETVGSGVRFVDGKARKSGYRHYIVRTVKGINDFASIKEVLGRHLRRILKENRSFPDLIVIDGGAIQLDFALQARKAIVEEIEADIKMNTTQVSEAVPNETVQSNINSDSDSEAKKRIAEIPIIGLAKRNEELYLADKKEAIRFDPASPGMRILRQLRDEAHRFAISHHRKRRNKSTIRHTLDSVSDIGPERKKRILKHFQDRKIEEVSSEELMEVPGIGKQLAEQIFRALQAAENTSSESKTENPDNNGTQI